ncbi:MAG: hypothetical protein U0791_14270 [Gemmataceae bacterium]
MPVYGYGRVIDQATELLRLEEVSFDLSAEQLRGVAAFLIDCADRISDGNWSSDHGHMPRSPDGVEIVVLHPLPAHITS